MWKAITSALSLLLIIVVLQVALPEVSSLLVEIITKLLNVVNKSLDLATTQTSV